MLTNNGSKPATLVAFEITSKATTNTKTWFLVSNADGEILEPGKSYKIRASTDESIPKIVEADRRAILKSQYALADNYELTAKYIEATGQKVVLCNRSCATQLPKGWSHPGKPGIPVWHLGQE